jgi:hypothetical protein
LKLSTFTSGQTVQYKVGTTALNTAVTWNTAYTIENNVNALMTTINNNTAATDEAARLWYSNNASGTFYLQLYYTQPGNWKGQSLNVYVNGAASGLAAHQPKRG